MKIFQLKVFLFVCFLALFGFISRNAAYAAVTGKVGVGTWNTQAEFTDVKVVKGGTTLYQSDFATGLSDWTTVNGTWGTANGNLQQTGNGTPALAFIGDSTWSDYTLTLRARKISGDEGFLIALGSPGDATTSWWNIGGFGNTRHLLQLPGFSGADYNGSVQTGVWYDLKVELSGNNIRCYINGASIHDATRMLDAAERTARFNTLINSPGFALLNGIEQDGLRNLAGRNVFIGEAARATFDAMPGDAVYATLTPAQQALIIRKVNRNRMTWSQGYGFGGSDRWRDDTITANADYVVKLHNSLSVFDKHLTVNNDPGVPTADANYDGWMRFGSQLSVRTFIHEIAHALGSGTYWRWYDLMSSGVWAGQYGKIQIKQFEGPGAEIYASGVHFYPYGMNYENEYSDENARRAILLIAAMRRDMGLGDQVNWNYDTSLANGTFSLVPRHATSKVLEVNGLAGANGDPLDIRTPNGGDNQQFQFDLQPEGTYRIRTVLPGNRVIELPGGNVDNGTPVKLWDDNNFGAQRWFMIPTDNGWYKIAPFFNNFKGIDVAGISTADGAAAQSWDYLDGYNQQWKLVPTEQIRPTTSVSDGTYTLTPRHAQDKVMEVLGLAGANGDAVDIRTANDGDNQKFLLDKQSDGTYRIRTNLAGNRTIALTNGATENGVKLVVRDDDSSETQRWFLIPTDGGWFKIAPKIDLTKSVDVEGISNANGALVQSWDYLGGNNQQWKLTLVQTNAAPVLGSVTLAPTSPLTNSQLKASYTATDAENDALTVTYVWKKNNVVLDGESSDTLDLSKIGNGDKNDSLSVTVIVSDGSSSVSKSASVTVGNSAPSISSVTLAPTSPSTNDTLAATVVASDEDKDKLSYSYVWKKNNVVLPGESGATLNLGKAGNGDVGDSITVTAVANDGSADSQSLASAPVKVALVPNLSPKVVSVLPFTVSDKVGAKRTLSVRVQDLNGARDIESVWLLINDRLNWSEGATFIYVPSAASPAKGLLYLRQGDAFLAPVTVGEGTNSSAVLDNGCASVVAKEVSVEVVGAIITVTIPMTVKEGLCGLNTLYARVQDQQRTVDAASKTGDQGFIRCGTYDVTSSFVTPVKTAPTVGALTPSTASTTLASKTSTAAAQPFTLQVRDEEGASDLDTLWFMAGKVRNWTSSATFVYVARTRRLYLRSDNGQQWLGGAQIGSAGTLENAQVRLDLAKVTATLSADGKGLTLTLPLQAKGGLVGTNKVWLRAQDQQGATDPNGDDQGYVLGGNWNVTIATPKATLPSSGQS